MNTLTALALGANGFLSSESALAPALCQSVINHWKAGELTQAFEAYGSIMALMNALNTVPGASVRRLKGVQRLMGRKGSYLRGPYAPITDSELVAIGKALDKMATLPGCTELVRPS